MEVSRREANKIKCRQQILKASRRLFKEKGYEDTMIEDVADKADISKATLYNYFPNKESLLVGTLEDQTETCRRYIEERGDAGSYERIKSALEFLVLDSIPFISISRRILFLNACETSHMYGKVNDIKELFAKLAEEAKQEGVFCDDVDNVEIVELLMSIYLNSQFQWKDIEDLTEEQCIERIERMLGLTLTGCFK